MDWVDLTAVAIAVAAAAGYLTVEGTRQSRVHGGPSGYDGFTNLCLALGSVGAVVAIVAAFALYAWWQALILLAAGGVAAGVLRLLGGSDLALKLYGLIAALAVAAMAYDQGLI